MTSTSSATVVGGSYTAGSQTRDPRIVVAYNAYNGALDGDGFQRRNSSMMGLAVSDDRGQTWRAEPIRFPSTADHLSGIGGYPAISSLGWMRQSAGGAPPPQEALLYVNEGFVLETVDPMQGPTRARKLVCTSSRNGATSWRDVTAIPPMRFPHIVTPSHPSVTVFRQPDGDTALLGFIGNYGESTARVLLTHSSLAAESNPCNFSNSPYAIFYPGDETQIRRVLLTSSPAIGPLVVVETVRDMPDVQTDENNALCSFNVEQPMFVRQQGSTVLQTRDVGTFFGPCRKRVPNLPRELELSHMDFAADAAVDVRIPNVATAPPRHAHLVMIIDSIPTDGIAQSEVVYRELVAESSTSPPTVAARDAVILSDALSAGELVFQPTVSAVALPLQPNAPASSDVFVTWNQMGPNGQIRVLGRRRRAGTPQWGAVQVLHAASAQATEALCATTDTLSPIWSRYATSVALMDGWPARGRPSDSGVRLNAFPLAVSFFTSSRSRPCDARALDAALFQELHAARWR